MEKSNNPLAMWDIRHTVGVLDEEDMKKNLSKIAKKWVFQIEKSDNGYIHFQGRISLIKKRRHTEKHIVLNLMDIKLEYFEPTTNPDYYSGEQFYMMKADTRIKGPWQDTDEVKVFTHQLDLFSKWELRGYQRDLYNMSTQFDMRQIDLIWDTTGNMGKSLFCEWMEFQGIAEEVPPYRMMDDIFQWVCTRPVKKCYIFDMPRGMKKDKLADLYSGIEVIKNGVAYDKRYKAEKIRFSRPRVFVFTNTLPNFDLMSKDRWKVWVILPDYNLTEYTWSPSAITDEE